MTIDEPLLKAIIKDTLFVESEDVYKMIEKVVSAYLENTEGNTKP